MAKEIGLPKGASKKAKSMDAKIDKAQGVKEGSVKDKQMDKRIVIKYGMKKGK